ncbi:MAG TPA: Na(+)-translocating NADH-quinone reductase subunit C [Myxococcota bacterium]|nr:Na(+)-translocating NADH-quinone reductase subunit C [Myxococcota bacterium]
MQRDSVVYTVGFAAVVCLIASLFVSGSAVALKDRQEANKAADKQKKVLVVAGFLDESARPKPTNEQVQQLFDDNISSRVVDMNTGEYADDAVDLATYDARRAAKDPSLSFEVEENSAKIARVPNHAVIYEVVDSSGELDKVILPIHGPGLWSTLYGFLAVDADGNTIEGITFYEHAETPGLGGEVDNPSWKENWVGRKVYDASGEVAIHVIKGKAGKPDAAPYEVDGLSGATLTAIGVNKTLEFWLGDDAFGPFLRQNVRGS